jgi:hypothetical protein
MKGLGRGGRLELDGDALVVNGRTTEYVRKARREAERRAGTIRGHSEASV